MTDKQYFVFVVNRSERTKTSYVFVLTSGVKCRKLTAVYFIGGLVAVLIELHLY